MEYSVCCCTSGCGVFLWVAVCYCRHWWHWTLRHSSPSCEENDSLSLDALEGKVSLHSVSITIKTRSFILNAVFFFFLKVHTLLCRSELRLNLNWAINSERCSQLVLLIYSPELGTGLRRDEGWPSTCIMTPAFPPDLYSLGAKAFCHQGAWNPLAATTVYKE